MATKADNLKKEIKNVEKFLDRTRKILKKEIPIKRGELKNTNKDAMCMNDFSDVSVSSSWIRAAQFQPHNKADCYALQKGDFILVVQKSGKRYVYPNVQRRVHIEFVHAVSKGKFYWYGGGGVKALRSFSTNAGRRLVLRRMKRVGGSGTRRR